MQRAHAHTHTRITFITVKTHSPTKDPRRSAPVNRNARKKRGNILIRVCFLTGSWEGPIISCYAKHLFYSMRTCEVSEPVSPFPLQHVPRCHEKGMCACCPSRKEKKQGFREYVARDGSNMTRWRWKTQARVSGALVSVSRFT